MAISSSEGNMRQFVRGLGYEFSWSGRDQDGQYHAGIWHRGNFFEVAADKDPQKVINKVRAHHNKVGALSAKHGICTYRYASPEAVR